MNHDEQLKVQGYLDGELPEGEAAEAARLLARDAEAQQLFAELQRTRTVLRENEPEHAVPESREFYWAQIERAIAQPAVTAGAQGGFVVNPFLAWVRRWFAPVTAVAGLALLLMYFAKESPQTVATDHSHLAEVETVAEGMGAITYRSYTDSLTFVWFYNQHDSGFAEAAGASTL